VKQACKAKCGSTGAAGEVSGLGGGEQGRGGRERLRHGEKILEGLVCVLSCVEPCRTFQVLTGIGETRKLELVSCHPESVCFLLSLLGASGVLDG